MAGEIGFQLGKTLLVLGIVLAALGLLFMAGSRLPTFGLGRLPGDIHFKGKSGSFYFPIVTCLLISAVVTLILRGLSFLMKR